jgi:hypothetical protein
MECFLESRCCRRGRRETPTVKKARSSNLVESSGRVRRRELELAPAAAQREESRKKGSAVESVVEGATRAGGKEQAGGGWVM